MDKNPTSKLFAKEYLYGHILYFLYLNADKRYDTPALEDVFERSDKFYLRTQLTNLHEDGMAKRRKTIRTIPNPDGIGGQGMEVFDYQISNDGFVFIKDLENTKKSNYLSVLALVISALSVPVSVIVSSYFDSKKPETIIIVDKPNPAVRQEPNISPVVKDTIKTFPLKQ